MGKLIFFVGLIVFAFFVFSSMYSMQKGVESTRMQKGNDIKQIHDELHLDMPANPLNADPRANKRYIVRVNNPNDFSVAVTLSSSIQGEIKFNVEPNSSNSQLIPNGMYDVTFRYSSEPDGLYKGDRIRINGNGVEITIVKMVGGNYGIRKVK